ncbi:hypothetical protein OKA04_24250 [Luteolibacter flavescens]|uniref:DUF3592 domain-containing protein n=1 Tax=Luteolibacter flavescens TaxID=1859460 RepID=A0ABT3FWT6_9BACT|nr:hypothetical protein [Luteolibacter flavescens]MCW1887872.1 hypothetical protein [Luteolibacter flavescens]
MPLHPHPCPRPRPLYRWKSFWLGVLVTGFLAWLGWRSMHYDEGFFVRVPGIAWEAGHGPALPGLVRMEIEPYSTGSSTFIAYSEGQDPAYHWFPPAFETHTYPPSPHSRFFRFAYWFLILLFLVPWSALLAWRWRRMRKLHRESEAALSNNSSPGPGTTQPSTP